MASVLNPSLEFGSDKGPIYPTQMMYWSPPSEITDEQTNNIGQLGTNLIAYFTQIQPPPQTLSMTYTLDNGKTLVFNMSPGTQGGRVLDISFEDGFLLANMQIFDLNDNLVLDGLYICVDPYSSDIEDIENWRLLKHKPNEGYFYETGMPHDWRNTFRGSEAPEDLDNTTLPDGGRPQFDIESDEIPFPPLPILNFLDTHMVRLYNPTLSELQSFASYLWTDNFFQNIIKTQNNPIESIIGFYIAPISPTTTGETIKIGNLDSAVSSHRVTQQYYYKDFGKIVIGENQGTYYDYAPFTKCDIYLPFIGVRQLDINEVMGSELWLQYMFDALTGSFSAMLHINRVYKKNSKEELNGILYHWNGESSVNAMLTGANYSELLKAKIGSVVTTAAAVGSVIATDGATLPLVAGAGAVATSSVKGMTTPVNVQHSGNLTSNAGMMSIQSPYVILSRPNVTAPATVKHDIGLQSLISERIGSMRGFIKMYSVHIEGVSCTDAEKEEIERVLKEGIIY